MQKRDYRRNNKQESYAKIGFVLSIIAILFLIINSIYLEVNKDRFVSELKLNPSISLQTIHTVPIMVDLIVTLWIAISVVLAFSLFFLKGTKCLWIITLILSILCFITFRIDSFVLGILATIFFSKSIKSS